MNAAMITLSTDKMIDEIEAKAHEELRQAQAKAHEELRQAQVKAHEELRQAQAKAHEKLRQAQAKAREEEREEMMLAALRAGIDDQALRALYPKLTNEEFQRLLHKVKAGNNVPRSLE